MANVVVLVWISKNIVLIIMLIIYCEKFYATVDEAKTVCIQLTKKRNCPSKKNYCLSKTNVYKTRILGFQNYKNFFPQQITNELKVDLYCNYDNIFSYRESYISLQERATSKSNVQQDDRLRPVQCRRDACNSVDQCYHKLCHSHITVYCFVKLLRNSSGFYFV